MVWVNTISSEVNKSLHEGYGLTEKSTILVVAAALVDRDGRVLLQQRAEGRQMAGLWEFPGGKVEPEERPEEALIRELKEELGIETDAACLAPATFASAPLGDRHLLLLLYVCRKWQGTPQALDAAALKWVRPKQMFALDMPPADQPLIGILDSLI
jgi:8-oxo-dGTP diphosphatase